MLCQVVVRKSRAVGLAPDRMHLEHIQRQVPHGIGGFAFDLVPAGGPDLAQFYRAFLRPHVTRDALCLPDRHIHRPVIVEFQLDRFIRVLLVRDDFQPVVDADSVIQMDRMVAFFQIG